MRAQKNHGVRRMALAAIAVLGLAACSSGNGGNGSGNGGNGNGPAQVGDDGTTRMDGSALRTQIDALPMATLTRTRLLV